MCYLSTVLNDRAEQGPRRSPWLTLLLVVGVVLTSGCVALIVLVAVGAVPAWALSLLSAGVWGPLTLTAWVLLSRHASRVQRLRTVGIPVRATVTAIRSTASRIGGRPVVRIGLSYRLPGQIERTTWIRAAPPFHLLTMLRPRTALPALVDPADPEHPMIDWAAAERESSPA